MDIQAALLVKAVEVASILNTVADDDQREQLEAGFERELNDRLFAGSLERGEGFSRAVPR